MMEANRLHREVALLSNELHCYPDNEVAAVQPIIERILHKRKAWTDLRFRIQYFQKNGCWPPDKQGKAAQLTSPEAEKMKRELASLRVLLSQNKSKLQTRGSHKNAPVWQSEVLRLESLIAAYQNELLRLKYQEATPMP